MMRLASIVLILIASVMCAAEAIPTELQNIGVDEHLGTKINLDLPFQDEHGSPVTLRNYFTGTRPVLFFLVYYGCPNLCTMVLNGAISSLKKIDLTPGKDFEVVAISIDPTENSALALKKKVAYLEEYGRPETAEGWHFLVGQQKSITAIASQIGFKYKWDEEQKQFAHASMLSVLMGDGKISRYFYGILYPERDLKVSLVEASRGHIGTIVDRILLFCYHYDTSTKKYVLMATRLMSAGGAITVLFLGGFLALAWRRERTVHV